MNEDSYSNFYMLLYIFLFFFTLFSFFLFKILKRLILISAGPIILQVLEHDSVSVVSQLEDDPMGFSCSCIPALECSGIPPVLWGDSQNLGQS